MSISTTSLNLPIKARPYHLARQDFRRLQRRLELPRYLVTEPNCNPPSTISKIGL